jgi:hypothetical protein
MPAVVDSAKPQRWLHASPVTLVEADYRGYSIYRYEFKFFALPLSTDVFTYENFKEREYDQCRLRAEEFDRIIIPWSFPETFADNSLEVATSKLSNSVEIPHSSGERRLYEGEGLHRLIYNKSYLASMFKVVPVIEGQTVLEAGCSDGLVCDMVARGGQDRRY